MYDRNENDTINEKVLFKGRPNLFFGCKNIFLLLVLLGAISYLAPMILSFVAEIQVHLVNYINLPLTTYATFAIVIIIVLIIVWILWILLNWKATEYIITNFRVVLKEGILLRKSHYMPFNHVQDITVSQGVFRRIFSIGHVIVVNAYDLTNIDFIDVHNPEDIQELIFNEMNKDHESYQNINERYDHNSLNKFRNSNTMNSLREDNYYQQQNKFNNYHHDDLNFNDQYKRQNQHNNEINHDYGHYEEYHSNRRNPNINNEDYLNPRVDGARPNLRKNNRFINKKQEDRNYSDKLEYTDPNNHNNKPSFNKSPKHGKNNKTANNKDNRDNKGLSVIDRYSRKFKKNKK